ncbi:hypothetical protein ARAM_002814 [Aspergillus rambellii]|uniref:HTH araC/xylS-type domain-containing protein n=1 Tax=Aspergillus rambellii TaxID=308745 RepID=A0A0F8VVD1_9EURO|nr:hypothetical protein ARAM_002814 [Aspergillus rambellii]
MVQPTSPQKIPRLSRHPQSTSTSGSSSPTAAAARWQAVLTRDRNATTFVYGVKTTKIYCRPSCPSRLARRANVEFYDTPSQAERGGFRPCKRCRPQTLEVLVNPQEQVIQRACETIRAEVRAGSKPPTLLNLASDAGLTASHFHRVFKKVMGVTPGKYTAGVMDLERRVDGYTTTTTAPIYSYDYDYNYEWGYGPGCSSVGTLVHGGHDDDGVVRDENIPPLPTTTTTTSTSSPSVLLFQPILQGEALVGGFEEVGAVDVASWNDFDALIAAEAEYVSSERGLNSLPVGFGLSESDFLDHVGFGDGGVSFVGGLARGEMLPRP